MQNKSLMLICINNDDLKNVLNPNSSFCIIAFAEYKNHLFLKPPCDALSVKLTHNSSQLLVTVIHALFIWYVKHAGCARAAKTGQMWSKDCTSLCVNQIVWPKKKRNYISWTLRIYFRKEKQLGGRFKCTCYTWASGWGRYKELRFLLD